MLPPSVFSPNKIQGIKIAAGRATWVYDDGKGYYNFVDEDAFSWKLTPPQLLQLQIDEQDLLDCVTQAEKQFGAPDEYRPKLGLLPSSGYMNIGATYVSKVNPNVICVFTPTSMDFQTTNPIAHDNAPVDAYFEWYYSPKSVANTPQDLGDFIKKYDDIFGKAITRNDGWDRTPTIEVPSYDEACVMSQDFMSESVRENFLQQVWTYYKTQSRGYKAELKESILNQWKRLNRVRQSLSMYEGE